ncbi:hypothetical protein [Mesonia aquimarina]|uniref:hypothetical protein n=1 Tax=Mesonia aquimarina TaxID=1504967 RepID=UPI000EF58133|nr:hypothetical protein [Mesonia aquimarina]
MAKDVVEIKGFNELNRKLKKLDDRVTRKEILKIQRKLAKPLEQAYARNLPVGTRDKRRFGTEYPAGTLSKSVSTKTVPASKVGGNPSVVIRPGKKGKHDAYYRFMVVKKGTRVGSNKRGSRKGKNTVVEKARDAAFSSVEQSAVSKYEQQAERVIQREIDKLSK